MTLPTPTTDTVKLSERAIMKYETDKTMRENDLRMLARETGYHFLHPGVF